MRAGSIDLGTGASSAAEWCADPAALGRTMNRVGGHFLGRKQRRRPNAGSRRVEAIQGIRVLRKGGYCMTPEGTSKQVTRRDFMMTASLAGAGAGAGTLAMIARAMPTTATTAQGDQPMSEPLSIIARMYVREGELEGFLAQSREVARLTKERDTGTFRYDWYLRDNKEAWILEEYASSEAWMEHRQHVGEALDKLFAEYADGHNVLVFGEPTPELFELGNKLMAGRIQWFSFAHGLDS